MHARTLLTVSLMCPYDALPLCLKSRPGEELAALAKLAEAAASSGLPAYQPPTSAGVNSGCLP